MPTHSLSGRLLPTFTLLLASLLAACGSSDAPDKLFINGTVLTVDRADSVVEAIAVTGNRISHIGSQQELMALASDSTEIIDLKGKTLIPGFVAAHEHPTLTALFFDVTDLSGFTNPSAEAMWERLRQKIAATPKGEWIYGMGLDPVIMPGLELPDREFLDRIAPDHPLFLIAQSMHSFWANSRALEAAGVDETTPDPGQGGYYGRDSAGRLNGFMSESASAPFVENLKAPLRMLSGYESALDQLLGYGVTSVASTGFNVPPLLARYAAYRGLEPRIRQFYYLSASELDQLPDSPDNGSDYFRILGLKLWQDGSPYTGSMYLAEPYLANPMTRMLGIPDNHTGEPVIDEAEFRRLIKEFDSEGWQLAIHSQGDRSNQWTAATLADSLPPGARTARHRIEHGVLLPEAVLDQHQALGVSPSFHINHILYYGDALRDFILGPERAQRVLPVKAAFERGLHPSLHADSPMFAPNPLSLMQTAVTRRTQSGQPLGIEQAISPQQALRAVTYNAAWQLKMEEKIGSIEVGKLADLTLLSGNPYQLPAERWGELRAERVWVGGRSQAMAP